MPGYGGLSFLANPVFSVLFFIAIVWSVVWKGIALWRSARNGSKVWFIVMLIVNTLGILEIIYIFAFSKRKKETATPGAPAIT